MGRKKKSFPPSKKVNFHFRMTKELYEMRDNLKEMVGKYHGCN